jgi:hypothetical protein
MSLAIEGFRRARIRGQNQEKIILNTIAYQNQALMSIGADILRNSFKGTRYVISNPIDLFPTRLTRATIGIGSVLEEIATKEITTGVVSLETTNATLHPVEVFDLQKFKDIQRKTWNLDKQRMQHVFGIVDLTDTVELGAVRLHGNAKTYISVTLFDPNTQLRNLSRKSY